MCSLHKPACGKKWNTFNFSRVADVFGGCTLPLNDAIHSVTILHIIGIVAVSIMAPLLAKDILDNVTICSFRNSTATRAFGKICLKSIIIEERSNRSLSGRISLFFVAAGCSEVMTAFSYVFLRRRVATEKCSDGDPSKPRLNTWMGKHLLTFFGLRLDS